MTRKPWDEYFLDIATLVSERATCPRRQVGAVLVRDRQILATGYNGSVQGQPHCIDVGCLIDETGSCRRTIHAEKNALLQAAKMGTAISGSVAYLTDSPCRDCAMALIQAGVTMVVVKRVYSLSGLSVLEDAGIPIILPSSDEYIPIVGIVGAAGSGKDTLASWLQEYDYRPIAFADPIHQFIRTLFPMTTKPRKVYQDIGESVRSVDSEAFVKVVINKVLVGGKWVITDVRHDNEAQAIQDVGGVLVGLKSDIDIRRDRLLLRDGAADSLVHHSEVMVDMLWDRCIMCYDNIGTLDEFEAWARNDLITALKINL